MHTPTNRWSLPTSLPLLGWIWKHIVTTHWVLLFTTTHNYILNGGPQKHKRHPARNPSETWQLAENSVQIACAHVCRKHTERGWAKLLCRINKNKAFWSITEQSRTQRASWQAARGCKLIIYELGDYPSPFILCSDSCYLSREITENRETGEES